MDEKLVAIEQKIDGVAKMLIDLTELVKHLSPSEAKKFSDDLRKQFESAEEKMRVTMNLVRKLTGNEAPEEVYSTHEAAERLGLERWTVANKCNVGTMRCFKRKGAGKHGPWKITASELARYEREGELNPPEEPPEEWRS